MLHYILHCKKCPHIKWMIVISILLLNGSFTRYPFRKLYGIWLCLFVMLSIIGSNHAAQLAYFKILMWFVVWRNTTSLVLFTICYRLNDFERITFCSLERYHWLASTISVPQIVSYYMTLFAHILPLCSKYWVKIVSLHKACQLFFGLFCVNAICWDFPLQQAV